MRLAYFDCPTGAAGDMILGALVDAGASFDSLRAELTKLALPGYTLERRQVMKGAFRATKIEVHLGGSHGAAHDHAHRHLATILDIIHGSGLPGGVVDGAARIFTRLAEAEGRAHGVASAAVVFHDVGAVDAIVDIVGACVGLHLL